MNLMPVAPVALIAIVVAIVVGLLLIKFFFKSLKFFFKLAFAAIVFCLIVIGAYVVLTTILGISISFGAFSF